jgi:hypothetical protein
MAENKGINQLAELTDLTGDWDFEVFDNDEAGVGVLKNKYATRNRIKSEMKKSDVQSFLIASITQLLIISSSTDLVEISLSSNWAPASITGLTKGKTIALRIATNGLAAYPYQITWPSNISFNDGIEPELGNNDATKYDWIYIQGIDDSNNGQIERVMYAG